jgi:hypothetical protein
LQEQARLNAIGKLALAENILQLPMNHLQIQPDRQNWPLIGTGSFSSICSMVARAPLRAQDTPHGFDRSPLCDLSRCSGGAEASRTAGNPPSAASLSTALRSVFSDFVDPAAIRSDMTKHWEDALKKFFAACKGLRHEAFLDVDYSDLVCDPIGVVRSRLEAFSEIRSSS